MAIELPKTALKDSIGWDELQARRNALEEKYKLLRRFVVLAHEDEWFIAMKGFHFYGNARRYADQLRDSGLTAETKIRDSTFSGPFYAGLLMPEKMMR